MSKDVRERPVPDAPIFEFGMKFGIEKTAVIACDTKRLVLSGMRSVN